MGFCGETSGSVSIDIKIALKPLPLLAFNDCRYRYSSGGKYGLCCCDYLQRLGHSGDSHPPILIHREQRPISGHEQIGLCRERGADHHIVIRVGHDARCWRWAHHLSQFRISIYQLIDRQQRGRDLLLEFAAPQNISQLCQQRGCWCRVRPVSRVAPATEVSGRHPITWPIRPRWYRAPGASTGSLGTPLLTHGAYLSGHFLR